MELHRERFEAWLFAQPRERVIEAGNGECCFLCSFVKETTNLRKAFFYGWSQWQTHPVIEPVLLPEWATRLVDPVWCANNSTSRSRLEITVGQMQDRYAELFGLPAKNALPEAKEGLRLVNV